MAIFFTLSGFVIALSYSHWDWRDRPAFNLIRLFFYRFARLYPAFLLFAVIIILQTPAFDRLNDGTPGYVVDHLLLAQAWLPVKYDGQLSPGDHFHVSWSLSVECGDSISHSQSLPLSSRRCRHGVTRQHISRPPM